MASRPNRNPLFTAIALVGLMFGPARDARTSRVRP
jgi:hypothetical protein